MTSKPFAVISALFLAVSPLAVRAEEGVFISLTRAAQPTDSAPTNVSVVTAEDIRRSGAMTLTEVLQGIPSMDVLETGTPGQFSNIRLRGVPTSNQVQVVVDDQPLGGVFLQDLDIGQISAHDIERVEVIRGGSSVLYGANTVGGVIHIVTKKARGDAPFTSLGYEMRSFETRVQRGEFRLPGKRADAHVSASRYRTGGFQRNSDGEGLSVSGGAGFSFESGARVAVEASRVDSEAGDPQGTAVPLEEWDGRRERESVNPDARANQENTLVRLRGAAPVGASSIQTVFYGSNQDYLYDDPDPFFPVRSEIDKNILGNDTRVFLPGKASVGASYERNEYRSKGEAKLHGVNWGLYAQKTFELGPLDILPALRFDQHGNFGNTYNPRLTLVLKVAEGLQASANAGRSFRSPTLLDLRQDYPEFGFFANPDLRPETAWSYDAGLRMITGEKASLSVTGFYTRIRERITITSNPWPAPNTLTNAPRAETSGAEVEAVGRWGRLIHRAAYTYQRALGNSLASSLYVPLRRTPRHRAEASFTWEAPRRWELTGGARYVSRQFENDEEGGLKIPGRTTLNARVAKRILGAEFFFAGENLTNRRYADGFGFGVLLPQPGRTFWGGMTIRFHD